MAGRAAAESGRDGARVNAAVAHGAQVTLASKNADAAYAALNPLRPTKSPTGVYVIPSDFAGNWVSCFPLVVLEGGGGSGVVGVRGIRGAAKVGGGLRACVRVRAAKLNGAQA